MCRIIRRNSSPITRRQFLALTGALTLTATCLLRPGSAASAPADGSTGIRPADLIRIGILLGTFSHGSLESRLDAVRASGLDCVQVSLDCAGLTAMPDQIPASLAKQIRDASTSRGINVASVQGTFNMCHPDPDQRSLGVRRLRVLAEACSAMGTHKIHLCTGTRDRESMWRRHPDNNTADAWRDMSQCVREATVIAEANGVTLAFEPEVSNIVDSAQKARRLLDEIGSAHLKVTFDAANFFHSGELPRMKEILDAAVALLGKDIVLAHAKDLDHDGDAGHLPAGHGKLDYVEYISLLHGCGFQGPLLLHGLSEAQVPECVAFLRQAMAQVAKNNSAPARP